MDDGFMVQKGKINFFHSFYRLSLKMSLKLYQAINTYIHMLLSTIISKNNIFVYLKVWSLLKL